ncbi:MAG: TolC family protein [Candidatus Omnitrophota bacterium]
MRRSASLLLKIVLVLALFGIVEPARTGRSAEEDASIDVVTTAPLKEPGLIVSLTVSLEDCIKLAAYNSFEVKLAKLDMKIAEQDKGIKEAVFDTALFSNLNYADEQRRQLSVFGGNFLRNVYEGGVMKTLPTGTEVTAAVNDTRSWTNSGFNVDNPAHEIELALDLKQPVAKNIFGVNDRWTITATKLAIVNADLDMKERIEILFADVEKAYWQFVFTKENLRIFREIRQRAKNLHETNIKSFDVGRIERADFLASEANVLTREKDVRIAENSYRRSEEMLKLLLNVDGSGRIYPAEDLKLKEFKCSVEDSLTTAFEKRRDYYKAKREIKIKDITLKVRSNERWPEVDLVGTYAINGIRRKVQKAAASVSGNDAYFFGGIEITLPVENNAARSEFKKADFDKEKAIIELKNVERKIVTDVGNAVRDYKTYETNVETLLEVVTLQREKLAEEDKRFGFGRSTTKTLIDYQSDYLKSQLEASMGLRDLEQSKVDLNRATNALLGDYEVYL